MVRRHRHNNGIRRSPLLDSVPHALLGLGGRGLWQTLSGCHKGASHEGNEVVGWIADVSGGAVVAVSVLLLAACVIPAALMGLRNPAPRNRRPPPAPVTVSCREFRPMVSTGRDRYPLSKTDRVWHSAGASPEWLADPAVQMIMAKSRSPS